MNNEYQPKEDDFNRAAIVLNNVGFKRDTGFNLAPVYLKGVGRVKIEGVETNDVVYLLKNKPSQGFDAFNLRDLSKKRNLRGLISCFGECCSPLAAYACGIENGISTGFYPSNHDLIFANTIGAIFGRMSKEDLIKTKEKLYQAVISGGFKEPLRDLYLRQFFELGDEEVLLEERVKETPRYQNLELEMFKALTREERDTSFITDIHLISQSIFPTLNNGN